MTNCKKCGERIIELSEEDMKEFGIINNENLCDECLEEERIFENTCPVHRCYCPDGFCEQCLIESEEEKKNENFKN
ncbi:MAG: hypothetical protein ACOCP8_05005 [archaeon]